MTPTNTKPANKSKTITFSCLNMSCRDQPRRTLDLNKTEAEYIPDTGAAMTVISEETAKRADLKVNPYDNSKVRVITADGKEVPEVPGYVEADVTLDNYRPKGVKRFSNGIQGPREKKPRTIQNQNWKCYERKCLTKSTIESFYDCDRDHDCALDHHH